MHRCNARHAAELAPPSHAFLSPRVWEQLRAALDLSARELSIAQLVFSDCSEAEMALQLGISPHTVHAHLKRLYLKLNVSGRAEVVVRIFAAHVALSPHELSPAQAPPEQATFALPKIG